MKKDLYKIEFRDKGNLKAPKHSSTGVRNIIKRRNKRLNRDEFFVVFVVNKKHHQSRYFLTLEEAMKEKPIMYERVAKTEREKREKVLLEEANKRWVGKRLGILTIIEVLGKNKNWQLIVNCKCDCGKEKKIYLSSIKETKSCGCVKMREVKKRIERVMENRLFDKTVPDIFLEKEPRGSSTTGVRNVHRSGEKFYARFLLRGKRYGSKSCSTIEEATRERDRIFREIIEPMIKDWEANGKGKEKISG